MDNKEAFVKELNELTRKYRLCVINSMYDIPALHEVTDSEIEKGFEYVLGYHDTIDWN